MKFDPKLTLPVDMMENLGASYLRNNLWVPISGSKEEVVILISDPSNYQRIMEIQGVLNARNYVFRVGLPEHILQYLGDTPEPERKRSVASTKYSRTLKTKRLKLKTPGRTMMKALLPAPPSSSW